jgi:Cof subfamily protein (haloacid dehalogenase superfamily)
MIKLVVSDMDGTLLSKKSGISDANLKAIQSLKKQHIEFAIASGRDYQGVYSIMEEYGIECEAILGNGAQYVLKDGTLIMSCYMNKEVVKDVAHIFHQRNLPYMIFTTKGFYTGQKPSFVREAFIQRSIRRFHASLQDFEHDGKMNNAPCNQLIQICDWDDFLNQDIDIIKVESFSLTSTESSTCRQELENIPTISYLSSFDDNYEVTDQNAQKGLILEKVIEMKGLNKDEVMVLGDGMNDLTLFECFPYSFAPMNADEKIKELAYRVVRDCEEDGFAEAIQTIKIS